MLRTSSYTIYVDLPSSTDEMLLVHGYTGAYNKVSRRVATYLRSLEVKAPPKPLYGDWTPEPAINGEITPPSEATIELLKKRGYLTKMTPEEEEAFFVKLATKLHHFQKRLMPSYIFMPTYSCNLRCPYCFQDHMRTNPAYKHLLTRMSPEVVDRIFAAMPQIEAAHGVPEDADLPRNITLFGGEPLLAENRSTIEYILERAFASGKANFSAVTNGTELEAYQDLLAPEKISWLQITLDGIPQEHDQRRIYADGKGSYEKIAQNITRALDLGVKVSVRMNIDRNNVNKLPDLADEIVARGWDKYKGFHAYTAVVTASNAKTEVKTTLNSWELDLQLNSLRQEHPNMRVIERPDDGLMVRVREIFAENREPINSFKASFCGAHNKMYVFDPFGDIYACWEKTGDPKIRIGHITEDSQVILNEELNQTWRNRTIISNPVCRKCRYSFSCGGGCAVSAMNHQGKFYTNYCDGFAHRFRASVAEAYLDYVAGTEVEERQELLCPV
ncbi:MAG: SPASM domain-containing protein [Microcystis viridis Mv_BB_P_19951000_S69]|uniref:SPASM domain-containing protein n=1 Tax=Microcystis viridis Mv_BB_P_19951000_S68D TaxID=2486270 RepID=A0A552HXL7_MICVR|nr:MAG: SPASM domain-containing protein [Microcystis viridis Mv_BB_P_19951000_S68]TRU73069.1 MAG: SPASM domain-containing protein [Microcystis viridis Mv_BB_P_19951000_S69]TRU75935.1 MAG: SPASM domain-containing protein [Microcystis viridis Mv_BB_P_19951000_S68D]TRU87002.1 MAG: SPASM domain-containing protein [Microcystis viridis Mv_BB_P_19951000_S69D]